MGAGQEKQLEYSLVRVRVDLGSHVVSPESLQQLLKWTQVTRAERTFGVVDDENGGKENESSRNNIYWNLLHVKDCDHYLTCISPVSVA